ncbi:hypothetical protein BGZ68_004599 [Mortierella alpina]|nr:hypothetical protein BGZ68_004599 [Mortierella alpina]
MSFLDFDNADSQGSAFLLPSLASTQSPAQSAEARDAADEDALLAEFKSNPKAALALAESYMTASQAPRHAMTDITPVPGFVVQTMTTGESSKVPIGSKYVSFGKDTVVFINVCSSDLMPKPSNATEAEIKRAINAEEGTTYQVPFQLSPPREYRDPVAKSYLVVDACIHTEPYRRAEKDFDYKLYIMELAMEWVEEKCRVELSRNFQLPNIKSKDELKKRSVILPKPPAIQELDSNASNQNDKRPVTMQSTQSTPKKSGKSAVVEIVQPKDSAVYVPLAGKDDIVPASRLLPCPNGTMGIIIEIDLPNHTSMDGVTLDVVLPDKLILHSQSQGQSIDSGKEYHVEVDLPNEPVDLNSVKAEFSKVSVVMASKTLAILNLAHNSIGDNGAQALAEALKTNSTLTTLNLAGNSIGDYEAQAQSEALKTNSTLTTLHLTGNSMAGSTISDHGGQALGEALRTNSTVANLNLQKNKIGDDGAKALAEALGTNSTVATLYLQFNEIGDDGAKALDEALRTNATLTTLNLMHQRNEAPAFTPWPEAARMQIPRLDLENFVPYCYKRQLFFPIMAHCATSAYYKEELGPTTSGAVDPDYAVSIEVYTPGALHVAKYAIQQHLCAYGGKYNRVKSSVTAKANDKFIVAPGGVWTKLAIYVDPGVVALIKEKSGNTKKIGDSPSKGVIVTYDAAVTLEFNQDVTGFFNGADWNNDTFINITNV